MGIPRFKRSRPLISKDNHLQTVQAIGRIVIDLMKAKGFSPAKCDKIIMDSGRVRWHKGKLANWGCGNIHESTSFWTVHTALDVLGISLSDILTAHYPDEKETVKGVIRNPEYM